MWQDDNAKGTNLPATLSCGLEHDYGTLTILQQKSTYCEMSTIILQLRLIKCYLRCDLNVISYIAIT